MSNAKLIAEARAAAEHSRGSMKAVYIDRLADALEVLEAENASLKSEIDYLVTGEE